MSDPRTLKRQYKTALAPMGMGVFVIRNQANGRAYVGGSLNLNGAMNRHRFELVRRAHRNRALQQDWLAFGAEQFRFEVLEHLREHEDPAFDYDEALATALTLWREEIPCYGDAGYNGPTPASLQEVSA